MSKAEKQKSIPVTSLKAMGGAAPEFRLPVTIKRLDGEEFAIDFTAKAMRKTEWAAKRDGFMAQAKAKNAEAQGEEAKEFSFSSAIGEDMEKASALAMEFVTGWDLEDDFNPQNLALMEDQFGGSLSQVLQAYDAAIFHGRLGN